MRLGSPLTNVKWPTHKGAAAVDGKTFFKLRVITSGRDCESEKDVEDWHYGGQAKWRSKKRLMATIKDALSGIRSGYPLKYVEVQVAGLPWHFAVHPADFLYARKLRNEFDAEKKTTETT